MPLNNVSKNDRTPLRKKLKKLVPDVLAKTIDVSRNTVIVSDLILCVVITVPARIVGITPRQQDCEYQILKFMHNKYKRKEESGASYVLYTAFSIFIFIWITLSVASTPFNTMVASH
mmetsp:Transcript_7097/g.10053  ORF Transcript_7097/g.10053 Transcript_7097/m.10053 type:complete len:117 (-) Transcript_7097:491-841(-)